MIRALVLAAMLTSQPAHACSLALSLGLDASTSLSQDEWRMQVDGTANALLSPQVRAAVNAIAPIRMQVFAWAALQDGSDWIEVGSADDLPTVAEAVRSLSRAHVNAGTAIGAAMAYGAAELRSQPCRRLVLDLSGDGKGNGFLTAAVAAERINATQDVTVNGIGIGPQGEGAFLDAKAGPGAFTMHAETFADFERVLVLKLLAEMLS